MIQSTAFSPSFGMKATAKTPEGKNINSEELALDVITGNTLHLNQPKVSLNDQDGFFSQINAEKYGNIKVSLNPATDNIVIKTKDVDVEIEKTDFQGDSTLDKIYNASIQTLKKILKPQFNDLVAVVSDNLYWTAPKVKHPNAETSQTTVNDSVFGKITVKWDEKDQKMTLTLPDRSNPDNNGILGKLRHKGYQVEGSSNTLPKEDLVGKLVQQSFDKIKEYLTTA